MTNENEEKQNQNKQKRKKKEILILPLGFSGLDVVWFTIDSLRLDIIITDNHIGNIGECWAVPFRL